MSPIPHRPPLAVLSPTTLPHPSFSGLFVFFSDGNSRYLAQGLVEAPRFLLIAPFSVKHAKNLSFVATNYHCAAREFRLATRNIRVAAGTGPASAVYCPLSAYAKTLPILAPRYHAPNFRPIARRATCSLRVVYVRQLWLRFPWRILKWRLPRRSCTLPPIGTCWPIRLPRNMRRERELRRS